MSEIGGVHHSQLSYNADPKSTQQAGQQSGKLNGEALFVSSNAHLKVRRCRRGNVFCCQAIQNKNH